MDDLDHLDHFGGLITTQQSPVQPSTVNCSSIQRTTYQYSLIQPSTAHYTLQEDRSGNSYAGGNGHTAKIARVNKLTSDVYEEKTSFGTFSQSLELLK